MVNARHLYRAFIQSAVQSMLLIHPFIHTLTQGMQGTNQLVRSNWGLGVLLDTLRVRSNEQPSYLLSHLAPIQQRLMTETL